MTRGRPARSPHRLVGVGLVALALLVSACTVPVNDEPVELSGSIVPETTTSTTTTMPLDANSRPVVAWFLSVQDGTTTLRDVPRIIEVGSGVRGVLANLFDQRPSDDRPAERGLTTAIPDSAELLSATPSSEDPSRLIVDVRGLFGDAGIQGVELRNALAQIVYTATNPATGISSVIFHQEGEPREALVDDLESTAEPVRRADYDRVS
jgi:spore germination protein GerM